MPRKARIIIPGEPHHVTQRGARRQIVFFEREDRVFYKDLLSYNAKKFKVEILAYCLMTNHVHHILVPETLDGLRWTVQLTHKRYADFINKKMGWKGHLWQERYYSCTMDYAHLRVAIKYVDRNPVEANIVQHAAEYEWSSAAGHCGLIQDPLLTNSNRWIEMWSFNNFHSWLGEPDTDESIQKLRISTARSLPCGSESYLDNLEKKCTLPVRPQQRGRPKKE